MVSHIVEQIINFVHRADPFIKLGELIALCLGIVAIWFARRQYRDSNHLLTQAHEQQKALGTMLTTATDHAQTLKKMAATQEQQFQDVIDRATAHH